MLDTTGRHPSTAAACRGLDYEHLPPALQPFGVLFTELAGELLRTLPDDPELTAALRKLREAKDCTVLLAAITQGLAQ